MILIYENYFKVWNEWNEEHSMEKNNNRMNQQFPWPPSSPSSKWKGIPIVNPSDCKRHIDDAVICVMWRIKTWTKNLLHVREHALNDYNERKGNNEVRHHSITYPLLWKSTMSKECLKEWFTPPARVVRVIFVEMKMTTKEKRSVD